LSKKLGKGVQSTVRGGYVLKEKLKRLRQQLKE